MWLILIVTIAFAGLLAALAAEEMHKPPHHWDDKQKFKPAADTRNHSLSSGSLP